MYFQSKMMECVLQRNAKGSTPNLFKAKSLFANFGEASYEQGINAFNIISQGYSDDIVQPIQNFDGNHDKVSAALFRGDVSNQSDMHHKREGDTLSLRGV
jgi:hypothetical protein